MIRRYLISERFSRSSAAPAHPAMVAQKTAGDSAVAQQRDAAGRELTTIALAGRWSSSEYCTCIETIGMPRVENARAGVGVEVRAADRVGSCPARRSSSSQRAVCSQRGAA